MEKSPLVTHCSWGKIEVDGFGQFKDVVLVPGEAREWIWEEPNRSHKSANSVELLKSLAETGADVVILTRGVDGVLQVPEETLAYARVNNIDLRVELTPDAIKLYGELVSRDVLVAAAIHTTC